MKVLLILQGHYRSFDKTNLSWKKALEGCDYECCFCTWDVIDSNTPTWYSNNKHINEKLTNKQIDLLKSFDPNVKILSQEFSSNDMQNIYAKVPLKVYMYKYNALKDIINSIDSSKYDMIIISRYDILIKTIKFKDITIDVNEIKIGGRSSNMFFRNIAASDLLCIIHPSNKDLFNILPKDIIERKFNSGEECYTDFYFSNFNKVNHIWNLYNDFEIIRMQNKENVLLRLYANCKR